MNPVRLDLTIVIEAGSLKHRVSLPELSLALGGVPLHELRTSLLGLFRDAFPHAPALVTLGEPTEGVPSETFGGTKRSERSERTGQKEIYKPERSNVRAGPAWARTSPSTSSTKREVAMLMELLDDPKGERAFDALVRKHSRTVIEQALALTLAVPVERITHSRAAYFTALVRSLDARSSSTPYDSSTSSTTT